MDARVRMPKLSVTETLGRLAIKYAPAKPLLFDRVQKLQRYSRHVPAFYSLLTPLLQLTTGSHDFHGGYFERGDETWEQAQQQLTLLLGKACGLDPSDRVLEVGSGIGGPAVTIAETFGCRVEGLNITASQVRRAARLARERHLDRLIHFTRGDALAMPFRWAQFDHAYAIESVSHIPDKHAVISEVARVTLPGARFGILDACAEDPKALLSDPEYNLFNIGWGVRDEEWTRSHQIPQGFEANGFRMLEEKDISDHVAPSTAVQSALAQQRADVITELYGREILEIILRTMRISERYVRTGLISYKLWVGQKVAPK